MGDWKPVIGLRWHYLASYIFLSLLGLTTLGPLIWMILTSFRGPGTDVFSLAEMLPTPPAKLQLADVRNFPEFCDALIYVDIESKADDGSSMRQHIWQAFPADVQSLISRVAGGYAADEEQQGRIITMLNGMISRPDFFVALNNQSDHFEEDSSLGARQLANRRTIDMTYPRNIVPTHAWHWENYRSALTVTGFSRALLNSVIVTGAVTIGLVMNSALAAYAFARLDFFGRDQIFLGYLATMMVPTAVTMIPTFILLRELEWTNTFWALIVPPMFSAYGVFMLRQFFLGLPRELEEAARIDGCSRLGIFWRIILPLSKPALTALAILSFIGCWRSFMWPLLVTFTRDMFTLPLALAMFQEMYGVHWTFLMAGSVMMIVPMLFVFIFGQRFFIEGIQVGAIKE